MATMGERPKLKAGSFSFQERGPALAWCRGRAPLERALSHDLVWESALDLFISLPVRCLSAAFFTAFFTYRMMPRWIRRQTERGQSQPIRSAEVAELGGLHAEKVSTPTMGGVVLLASTLAGGLFGMDWSCLFCWMLPILMLIMGSLGLWDDLLKVKKKSYQGLHGRNKLFLELFVGAVFAFFVVKISGGSALAPESLYIPWWGVWTVGGMLAALSLGGLATVAFAGTVNAVNLTDGLDGLAPGLLAMCFGTVVYGCLHLPMESAIVHPEVVVNIAVWCSAAAAACFTFLWFNASKAMVIMGDTGSLGFGALLGASCIMLRAELVLLILGGLFVVEALSVMIQVAVFQKTGRRVFRCTPIHHHFEMAGVPEPRLVVRFWMVQVILCMVALWSLSRF